jgi:dTDP-4-dehydrorhamnose reductase
MLELWGGHECTVNRVGDRYYDQTRRSGHHDRLDDLDRFASLGLKALRYPLVWERAVADVGDAPDWSWSDTRLDRIRQLGMRPIAGLLHHGSGPRGTDLTDTEFPRHFAAFARGAAERYPWIEAWTPINEPLTTARFSALYGVWYPHQRDEGAFWAALLNQIEATCLAMTEIRKVNPAARLIQTEDLGRTYGTRPAGHQIAYDNARRWMTWDLLCGRVTPEHFLHGRLKSFGLADRLASIADAPCPPDVIGVNHYLTSDRFLDHNAQAYPSGVRGGNEWMAFADVEAIRVATPAPGGLEGALEEAWTRYGLPLAVTESHNGCTREEQVRWVREAWEIAGRLRVRGVDLRAVTAWALLGSYDWQSLLTKDDGAYEVGAYDVRGVTPRPTAVAAEVARIAAGQDAQHPATSGPGWWRRDVRLEYKPVIRTPDSTEPRREWRAGPIEGRPLLIAGATGTLGQALAHACELRGIPYRLTSRQDLQLENSDSIARCLDATEAWGLINAAGWVRVDQAETEPDACHAANATGAINLAHACAERGMAFLTYSSDLVFDGRKGAPYVESDATAPLNVYGASKAAAEHGVLDAGGRPLVIRTSAFFSPHDPWNFADQVRRTLMAGQIFSAADDLVVSPTYVPHLVEASLDLMIDGDTGVRHVANGGAVTWAGFAIRLARALGLDEGLVDAVPHARFAWAARRPVAVPLATERGEVLPNLEQAIHRYVCRVGECGLIYGEGVAGHRETALAG